MTVDECFQQVMLLVEGYAEAKAQQQINEADKAIEDLTLPEILALEAQMSDWRLEMMWEVYENIKEYRQNYTNVH